jgi:hypothetical protein
MINIIILVINNMQGYISKDNLVRINQCEGTNYPEVENLVTYQMMYDSREEIGSQRGYFRTKDGRTFWVLPYLEGRVEIEENNPNVMQYSLDDYLKLEETFDEEN